MALFISADFQLVGVAASYPATKHEKFGCRPEHNQRLTQVRRILHQSRQSRGATYIAPEVCRIPCLESPWVARLKQTLMPGCSGDVRIKGTHDPLISEELFAALQNKHG